MNPMADHIKSRMEDLWDPKIGFTIPLKPFDSYHLITCVTSVNDTEFTSLYILKRQSESF